MSRADYLAYIGKTSKKKPATARSGGGLSIAMPEPVQAHSGDKTRTVITFMGKVAGLNGSGGLIRQHWSVGKKLMEGYVWAVRAQMTTRHAGQVRVELIRYSTGREMDMDNLASTGKN